MGSIKVVVQRPGEISHVIYINKELFIGECNRWVGGLSTDIMTDCGLCKLQYKMSVKLSDK